MFELFESLGLSPNEAKIYQALVEHGESPIGQIAVTAKIHRRNAYDAINRLLQKGLCFQTIATGENIYSAVDPDKLTELLAEKQRRLEEALPALRKKFRTRASKEEAFIFRGDEGLKNVWRQMLRVGENNYTIGAKAQWFDPRLDPSRAVFFKEAERKGIRFFMLLDRNVPAALWVKKFSARFQSRILPKEYSTSAVIQIFGDYVVTYTGAVGHFDPDTVMFVIRSRDLAAGYRKWFEYMWSVSTRRRAAEHSRPR